MPTTATETIESLASREYKFGFSTDIEQDQLPAGLDEDVIRVISAKKEEPEFMLEWRLHPVAAAGGDLGRGGDRRARRPDRRHRVHRRDTQ